MRYKEFKKIPIDRTTILQSELDISNKNKSNLFQWNGQFSPQFVETMLKKYSKLGDFIIDPFMGVGTTVIEACKLELNPTGVELNPAAYKLASVYKLCATDKRRRATLIEETFESIKEYGIDISDNASAEKKIIIDALRILCGNDDNAIEKKMNQLRNIVIGLPYTKGEVALYNDDARNVMLDKQYDLLFTSPPYINVFNYHQQYRKCIEEMGYNVLEIAKSEIGSNRKNRGNRFFSVIQYCIDMTFVMNNCLSNISQNGRMIFVVGRSSTVLGEQFCNSQIIYEILVRIFRCKLILRQERHFMNKYGVDIYEDILHFSVKKDYLGKNLDYYLMFARKIGRECLQEKMELVEEKHKNFKLLRDAYEMSFHINPSEILHKQ